MNILKYRWLTLAKTKGHMSVKICQINLKRDSENLYKPHLKEQTWSLSLDLYLDVNYLTCSYSIFTNKISQNLSKKIRPT